MPKLTVLPHAHLCPEGAQIDAKEGVSICDTLLANGIEIEHACEKSCACTTCHVVVRAGGESLAEATEDEEDMLDKAWGLEAHPDQDPQQVRFTDLHRWVLELPEFNDDPNKSGEKILEAIQMMWIEEAD